MEDNVDFVGHIDISPPLNEHEREFLAEYGPTPLPLEIEEFVVRLDHPGARSEWDICDAGCCLTWRTAEESSAVALWLRFFIAHFLKSTATARDQAGFEHFTFDHSLDGTVVGCCRDTKELIQVTVRKNRVTTKMLRLCSQEYFGYPMTPHETRPAAPPTDPPGRCEHQPEASATVIDLTARRARM